MMQSCTSAAKRRSGGPILPIGMKAKGLVGNPPPRTIIISRGRFWSGTSTVLILGFDIYFDLPGVALGRGEAIEATGNSLHLSATPSLGGRSSRTRNSRRSGFVWWETLWGASVDPKYAGICVIIRNR